MRTVSTTSLIAILITLLSITLFAQDSDKEEKIPHEFKIIKQIETTPVESQDNTGTCWSFATTSFLETELIRMDKGTFDLSEMFFVRHTYPVKSALFRRYHGLSNFGQGGQAHDVINAMRNFGIVPKSEYDAKMANKKKYNHSEFAAMLKSILDVSIKKKSGKLTKQSDKLFNNVLDIYLGEVPEKFEYDNVEYTPESFRDTLGLNPDDYIEITSYTHHPFYEAIDLEVPDNFTRDLYYNVPFDELVKIIDNALETGYSVCWDGDVSKDNFYKSGYAVVPIETDDDKKVDDDGEELKLPEVEKEITQELRQEAFDNYSTTDDHLMHMTGLAENQDGTKFYYVKNSWGTGERGIDGYWYFSEPYVRLKTIAIMVHKDAIPEEIKSKLGL